ncbi:MAG: hypothetical protein ACI4DY_01030 [Monoglobaceae bacterium]
MKIKRIILIALTAALISVNVSAQVSGTLDEEFVKNDSFAVFFQDGELVDCTASKTSDQSSYEILSDGSIKITSSKQYEGIKIDKAVPFGLTADNRNDAFLCFDIKTENMSSKSIRPTIGYGNWNWPNRTGKVGSWDMKIEDTDDWQQVKIPIKDFDAIVRDNVAKFDFSKTVGIRIDSASSNISSANPAYMYLKDIRIITEKNSESGIEVSAYYEDAPESEAEFAEAGKTLVVKADLSNGMLTKKSGAVVLMAVYKDDRMIDLKAAEFKDVSPESSAEQTLSYTFDADVSGYSVYVITCDKFSNMTAVCDDIYLTCK